MKPLDRLTDKIEIRLQFVVVILVFFLTVFSGSLLQGCMLVAVYIIDYIFFAVRAPRIKERYLKWINVLTLIGTGSFIIPLALIALSTQKGTMPTWQGYAWIGSSFVSIWLMFLAPVAILLTLAVFGINWRKQFGLKSDI
jgi:uncharacterized membrane protein